MRDEESVFAEVIGTSPVDRAAAVDRACAGDTDLRRRVEALLCAHDRARGILDGTPPGLGVATDTVVTPAEPVGSLIGPYKLLERLGEGGMGVVYMAEQQRPVRRVVALKIIKPGMDSSQVVARFEAERQALAMMDYPNIARVFDAGTTDAGRPYFAMELVKGVPLTDYCDQNKLTPRQRLELFVLVCQAVQHAHTKGVIHRDLKPTNVLVTLHDGKPVPKIIDFGIAKATGGNRLTEHTLFTNYAQMVGTPLYMSPEQAELSGLDVDTRSDVYSLGVLLYELLTGTTPVEKSRLTRAAYDEIRRIIREEDPPKPSTRLSTLAERLTAISGSRGTEPKRLGQLVRGELDWIVMKCLEKDRTRRYETASAVASDVLRHLTNRAVEACPPSAVYRMKKFVSQHRAGIISVAAALLVAAGLASLVMFGFVRERKQREAYLKGLEAEQKKTFAEKVAAEDAKETAGAVTNFLKAIIAAPEPGAHRGTLTKGRAGPRTEVTIRQALLEAVDHLDHGSLSGRPKSEVAVRNQLAMTFLEIGMEKEAEGQARKALEVVRQHFGEGNLLLVGPMTNLGNIRMKRGDYPAAEVWHRKALGIATAATGDTRKAVADVTLNLGTVLSQKGDLAGAEAAWRDTMRRYRELGGDEDPGIALSLENLASVMFARKDFASAEKYYAEAIERRIKQLGPVHITVAKLRHSLGMTLGRDGDLVAAQTQVQAALRVYRELLEEDHPDVVATVATLRTILGKRGDMPAVQRLKDEVLLRSTQSAARNNLARQLDLGIYDGSEEALKSVTNVYIAALEPEPEQRIQRLREARQALQRTMESHADPGPTAPRAERDKWRQDIDFGRALLADADAAILDLRQGPRPFAESPARLPGLVQAEDFDRGGYGVSYLDIDLHADGVAYRATGVDFDPCKDEGGGYNVANIRPGEWLAYTVEVRQGGTFDLDARVSCISSNGQFHVECDGTDVTGPLTVPNTGDWQKWQTITRPGVKLTEGRHVLRIAFDGSATDQDCVCNLNWIALRAPQVGHAATH